MNKQNGIGYLLVIIVLLVVGILGYGGWYVWSGHQDKNKNTQLTIEDTNQETQNWFQIKELGVEFQLPDGLEGFRAKYSDKIIDFVPDTKKDIAGASFDTKKFRDAIVDKSSIDLCGPEESEGFGSLLKLEPNTPFIYDSGSNTLTNEKFWTDGVTVDNYFYAYDRTHVCSEIYSKDDINKLSSAIESTLRSIK